MKPALVVVLSLFTTPYSEPRLVSVGFGKDANLSAVKAMQSAYEWGHTVAHAAVVKDWYWV